MKKTLLLFAITLTNSIALHAQVTPDSTGNVIPQPATAPTPQTAPVTTPVAPPPPPPPPPAATTTTTTTTVAPVAAAPAPNSTIGRLRFGAFVAPNISWMKPVSSTDDAGNYKVESNGGKVGFTYGLMVDYNFAPNYGLVSGLSINATGGKILTTAVNTAPDANKVVSSDFDYKLQYLDIPIALKLRTDDIKKFRFFGQLGLTLGINIAKKADYTVEYYDANSVKQTSTGSNIKLTGSSTNIAPVMFQMNIGAGGEFPLNNKLAAYFGIFFNNGFTPDATSPNEFDNGKLGYLGSFNDGKIRLNNLALRLGLFF